MTADVPATVHLLTAFEVELVADQFETGVQVGGEVTSAVVRRPDGSRVVYVHDPAWIPEQRQPPP